MWNTSRVLPSRLNCCTSRLSACADVDGGPSRKRVAIWSNRAPKSALYYIQFSLSAVCRCGVSVYVSALAMFSSPFVQWFVYWKAFADTTAFITIWKDGQRAKFVLCSLFQMFVLLILSFNTSLEKHQLSPKANKLGHVLDVLCPLSRIKLQTWVNVLSLDTSVHVLSWVILNLLLICSFILHEN